MRRTRTVLEPCVIWHYADGREPKHIIHGTALRAQRNAAMASVYGAEYHVHETTRRTLYGPLAPPYRCHCPDWYEGEDCDHDD